MRLDRNYPNLYFGQPGRGLMTLPFPRGGISKPFERQTFDFVTGSGNHAVSSLSTGSRIFDITWEALHLDNYNKLDQYRIGANGPGPWVLFDPSMPNLLPPNVAASTGLYNDTSEMTNGGGAQGTLASANTNLIHRVGGYRAIRWRWTTTPAADCTWMAVPLYRNWAGTPVIPGASYAFSAWVIPDGTVVTNPTARLDLVWRTSTNGVISTSSSGSIATGSGWYRLSVVANAPSNAAFVIPTMGATGSSVASGGSIYIDEMMLEQDTVVNDWAASTGVRPVEIVGLTDTTSNFASRFRTGVQLQLRELAR